MKEYYKKIIVGIFIVLSLNLSKQAYSKTKGALRFVNGINLKSKTFLYINGKNFYKKGFDVGDVSGQIRHHAGSYFIKISNSELGSVEEKVEVISNKITVLLAYVFEKKSSSGKVIKRELKFKEIIPLKKSKNQTLRILSVTSESPLTIRLEYKSIEKNVTLKNGEIQNINLTGKSGKSYKGQISVMSYKEDVFIRGTSVKKSKPSVIILSDGKKDGKLKSMAFEEKPIESNEEEEEEESDEEEE